MNKAIPVYVLIRSLSKSEKRYFRMHSNLQSGQKAYLALFDLMDQEGSTPEEVGKLFSEQYPGKNYDVALKHLYTVLLESLTHLRKNHDIQTDIFDLISKADILFERGLSEEAFKMLGKASKLAISHEKDALQLLIRRTELRYRSALDFQDTDERTLVRKQMQIMETMKYARSSNLHTQLYDILKHRFIHKGRIRTATQKEALNDLLLQELNLVANSSYKGFESEKLHLLFQATYFLHAGNYDSALRYYHRLIALFEANRHLLMTPPTHYLNALTGILDTLQGAQLYDKMDFFIDKLRELEIQKYASDFILSVHTLRYLYESTLYLKTGQTERALKLKTEAEESLFRKSALLGLGIQLQLHVHVAILYLTLNRPKESRKEIKKIFAAGKSFANFPLFRTARLIHLLLQAELDNPDYVDYEINALRREIRLGKRQNLYATEKLLFKFFREYPLPQDQKARYKIWKGYEPEALRIRESKYELTLLSDFDFLTWIENRLTGRHVDGCSVS